MRSRALRLPLACCFSCASASASSTAARVRRRSSAIWLVWRVLPQHFVFLRDYRVSHVHVFVVAIWDPTRERTPVLGGVPAAVLALAGIVGAAYWVRVAALTGR